MNVYAVAAFFVLALIGSFGLGYSLGPPFAAQQNPENKNQPGAYDNDAEPRTKGADKYAVGQAENDKSDTALISRTLKFLRRYEKEATILSVVITGIFTAVLAIATSFLWYYAGKQAQDMKETVRASIDQLTLAFPPRLDLTDIHMWEKGAGRPLDPNNKLPSLMPGTTIEGAAFIVNFGRETADIYASDIVAGFFPDPITMFYPGWENPGQNPLKAFLDRSPDYPTEETATTMRPGDQARWAFEKQIGERKNGEAFYVIGNVGYRDRLNTRHGIYFVRRYDPKSGRFVRVEGRDKEVEEK